MKITEVSYGARRKPPQRFIIQNSAAAGSAVGGLPACALGPLVSLACRARVRVVRGARKPVVGPKQWRKPSDFPAARLESPWEPSRSAPTPVGSQNAPKRPRARVGLRVCRSFAKVAPSKTRQPTARLFSNLEFFRGAFHRHPEPPSPPPGFEPATFGLRACPDTTTPQRLHLA